MTSNERIIEISNLYANMYESRNTSIQTFLPFRRILNKLTDKLINILSTARYYSFEQTSSEMCTSTERIKNIVTEICDNYVTANNPYKNISQIVLSGNLIKLVRSLYTSKEQVEKDISILDSLYHYHGLTGGYAVRNTDADRKYILAINDHIQTCISLWNNENPKFSILTGGFPGDKIIINLDLSNSISLIFNPEVYLLSGQHEYSYDLFKEQMAKIMWQKSINAPTKYITPSNYESFSLGTKRIVDVTSEYSLDKNSLLLLQVQDSNKKLHKAKIWCYDLETGAYSRNKDLS